MRLKLDEHQVYTRPGLSWISSVLGNFSSHLHSREEAETQVSGYSGAKHRRFPTLKSALDWVNIPIGQLAPWVQEALSEDTRQEGTSNQICARFPLIFPSKDPHLHLRLAVLPLAIP